MYKFLVEHGAQFPILIMMIIILGILFPVIRGLLSHNIEAEKFGLQQLEICNSILKSNLEKPSAKHRFLTEQLFSKMFKYRLEYDEVKVLLKRRKPSKSFDLYAKARFFLKLSNNRRSFVFKKYYPSITFFGTVWYKENFKELAYYMFASTASMILFYVYWVILDNNLWWNKLLFVPYFVWAALSLLFGCVFAAAAFSLLKHQGDIKYAIEFMNEGEKYE